MASLRSTPHDALICRAGVQFAVAAGATVRCAVVKNSIINENASVELILLDGSLIGDHAAVKGHFKKLNVGDSSEIEMA